ncbi:hypothetical protein I6N95_06530 [Vagococcus sp. BWB3-3]|uniref:S-layer protein n=1 Tax=Vagococcus allomyrinae TaxID=2794353 RepID=A0A940PAW0_9ENTE|nr:hypothetical protein [Vagococcus allomyrinae]MBP1040653.1 hypothetical protein [Vagococcus allomyrinae]
MRKRTLVAFLVISLVAVSGCSSGGNEKTEGSTGAASKKEVSEAEGQWRPGEFHTHSIQSNDTDYPNDSVEKLILTGIDNGFDWLVIADHLRMSGRDINGKELEGDGIPAYKAIEEQQKLIKSMEAAGELKDTKIFSGFEWDVLGLDHASVGIIDEKGKESLAGIKDFEYLYGKETEADQFSKEDIERLGKRENDDTKANTFKAVAWLKENYPDSYLILNHPSRKNGEDNQIEIEDIRKMNDIAPEIAFGFEGMLGNQMASGGNRGELVDSYGGTDVLVAKVGGVWDALLGEGRRFWNYANSDYHFKVSKNRLYSSGYWPGEYSKNYTFIKGDSFNDIGEGLRSGKSFSTFGDLINELDFTAADSGAKAEMGETLAVSEDEYEITIRFKSPKTNNFEVITEHETEVTNEVKLDHVDLISGEVTDKIPESSPDYKKTTNESTKVLASFTESDWKVDEEGFNVITYKVKNDGKNHYYRLRGTNLGHNVDKKTKDGEPLQDRTFDTIEEPTAEDNEERFNNQNDRNYSEMWFYSNPIFVEND